MSALTEGNSGVDCAKGGECFFIEEYYGNRCRKCGLFFAFGCAPWDDPEDGYECDDSTD